MAETSTAARSRGYRVGGTIHVIINQPAPGFTTSPEAGPLVPLPPDIAKMVRAPIFHVNSDDPEACVRWPATSLRLPPALPQDVGWTPICYRRHGHNEGDDRATPSR